MATDKDPTVLAGSDDLTGKTIGRFQITVLLGKGGMGEVYLAEDSLLKRPVALKRVSAALRAKPDYRELLIKEAARASRLNDEHVAHIHDVVQHEGELFLVMEYVEGQSLRQRMNGPIAPADFLPIALQCVEALVAAYQSGIAHRDIKPENIMITTKGRVKICDFGLARQGGWIEDTTMMDRTPEAGFRGTPAYMAPEALLNREPDFRADMFSLGIVFYELLAGRHPFRDDNNQISTADRIIHADPPALAGVNESIPWQLSNIVQKMLNKKPADRFKTPAELLLQLQGISLETHATRRHRPQAIRSVLLLLLLALTVGIVVFLVTHEGRQKPESRYRNLVVLPIRAIGGNPESQFYSDGLTETLATALNNATAGSDLQVAPASEVRARRVTSANEARKQFSADIVLAGTLNRSDSLTRLSYSLYESGTLRQIAADTISTDSSNAFALEQELVKQIAATLNLSGTNSAQPATPKLSTTVAAAYESYVDGRGYLAGSGSGDQVQTAIQSLERATQLDPGYARAYASLGEAYWARFQATNEAVWLELARNRCEKAGEIDARSVEAKTCLGTVAFGTGQYEASIRQYASALTVDSRSDAAYLGLARAQEKAGNYQAAEDTLRKAVRLKPNYYLVYARLGQFYLRRARYTDAIEQFQREISLIPNGETAYMEVGAAYIYLGRYDDAVTVLRRSIELRPTPGAYSNLGSAYLRLRQFDNAIPVFQQAVKLFPRSFIFAGNLARAYHWSSAQRDKAPPAFERAIELALDALRVNPRDSDADIMLARYYVMLGKRSPAIDHMNRALELRPQDPEYFSITAVVQMQLGDPSSALSALQKAIALGWSSAEVASEIEFDPLRSRSEFKHVVGKN